MITYALALSDYASIIASFQCYAFASTKDYFHRSLSIFPIG